MTQVSSLQAQQSSLAGWRQTIAVLCAVLAMTMLFSPAYADDEPSTYSPDHCEFSVTFPEAPYETKKCEDGRGEQCYNLISYTQTYGLESTVNFRVICNPTGPDVRRKYDETVSLAAVRAMGRRNTLTTLNTSFRDEGAFRLASLVGEGTSGRTPMIYIAQLWVGENSVMSVEGELVGEALDDADTLFSTVMKSVGPKAKDKKPEDDTGKDSSEEQSADDERKDGESEE